MIGTFRVVMLLRKNCPNKASSRQIPEIGPTHVCPVNGPFSRLVAMQLRFFIFKVNLMRKCFLALALIPMAVGTASADFVGSAAGGALPDDTPAGLDSVINVNLGTNEVITNVSININGLSHTWSGDIIGTLSGPGGSITIMSRPGGGGFGDSSNFNGNYTFNDTGADMWAALAPLTNLQDLAPGTYFAADGANTQQFFATTFGGTLTNGAWTLNLSDNALGDTGSYTSWDLNITSFVIPEPASLGLLGVAGMGLAFYRRRK